MADPKWTVSIIFQNFDVDDGVYFECLKEDIEKVDSNNELKGLVKFFVLRHDERDGKAIQLTTDETGKLNPFGKIFCIPKFYSDSTFEVAKSTWTDFLKNAAGYNCDHFLMTHGHGSGLAFATRAREKNRDKEDLTEGFITNMQVMISHNIIQNYSNDIVNDNMNRHLNEKHNIPLSELRVKIDVIPVNILKLAVEEAFNNEKIAFLYFGNCFMQTIENGYLFRNTVSYIGAGEGFYRPAGTDFQKLFETMAKGNGPSHHKTIAKTICENIPQKLNDSRMINHLGDIKINNIKNSFSFSVNDLSKYCDLKMQISLLADELLKRKAAIFDHIGRIRGDIRMCTDVWQENLLGITDFLLFCKNVALDKEFEGSGEIHKIIQEIVDISDSSVIARYYPFGSFDPTSEAGTNVNPNGASIFLPRMKPPHDEQDESLNHFMEKYYIDNKYITVFLENNSWRQFVIDFYYYKNPRPLTVRIANFIKRFF